MKILVVTGTKKIIVRVVNNFGIQRQFTRACRHPRETALNSVEKMPKNNTSANLEENYSLLCDANFSNQDNIKVAMINDKLEKIKPLNVPITIRNTNVTLLVDSGSVCRPKVYTK